MQAHQEIRDQSVDHRHPGILCTLVLAMLMASISTAFADVSPQFGDAISATKVDRPGIQLAQASLPPGVGSLDDYVRQGNEGASRAGVPPQGYSPQAMPPQSYYPQTVPSQEWNYGSADPNAERSALIGAAVVGALAVGLWAFQQHQIRQAQRRARKRFSPQQRAYANQIE